MRLRGGQETKDVRCGLIFDDIPKDAMPLSAPPPGYEPDGPIWWPISKHLNQEKEGACVGMAIAHALDALHFPCDYGRALSIYYIAQLLDDFPGGEYPKAMPKGIGTTLLAGLNACKLYRLISQWHYAFSVDAILAGLPRSPAIMATKWFKSMNEPDKKTGAIKVIPQSGLFGGHCYCINGYDPEVKRATVWQSWGIDYGYKGNVTIARTDLEILLNDGGQCVFLF